MSSTHTRSGMSFFDLDIDIETDVDEFPGSPVATSVGTTDRRRTPRLVGGALGLGVAGAVIASLVVPLTGASADPSSSAWSQLRNCESSNNYSINTGNGYYGAYQFNLATWRSVGGRGYPNLASRAEQDARALIL